ncbi:MAG: carbamoyltransferase C-terminal domain-containing protein [Candidatus Micrarchaeia archaeon]
MAVLGIGDSHDAGCAVIAEGMPVSAVNEERFTKNKNEVGFPYHSIRYATHGRIDDIDAVALAWIGGNALISRVIPSWDAKRRKLWRRELPKPSRLSLHVTNSIYKLVQNQNPKALWRALGNMISSSITRKRLASISKELAERKIYVVEHHLAHAAAAYYGSGFREALVITLDGAGDGLSGTVSIGEKGHLKRLAAFKASASLGIFYGAATVACDLRYSEDEGKLMSLAAYSYPAKIEGLDRFIHYNEKTKQLESDQGTRSELLLAEYMKDHVLSNHDRESFAYAVQRHVEEQVLKIVEQWIAETGIHNVAVGGGFFSNVITNMRIEHMPEVKNFFVFPHMGDGGLSYGSASYIDFMLNGRFRGKQMDHAYFGPEYSDSEIESYVKRIDGKKLNVERLSDPVGYAADLILANKIILWFQGRMEYGPRALGNRSVLALPDDPEARNNINIIIKKRPYYQPFASTVLEEDARKLFEDYVAPNRFMTSANTVRGEHRQYMVAASHIDHTTRPQVLGAENRMYRSLIARVKKRAGIGAVLNTSFNKHGKPIVMSPEDAIWTLENTGADTLIMGNYLIEKKRQQ